MVHDFVEYVEIFSIFAKKIYYIEFAQVAPFQKTKVKPQIGGRQLSSIIVYLYLLCSINAPIVSDCEPCVFFRRCCFFCFFVDRVYY